MGHVYKLSLVAMATHIVSMTTLARVMTGDKMSSWSKMAAAGVKATVSGFWLELMFSVRGTGAEKCSAGPTVDY